MYYAADTPEGIEANLDYARAAIRDSLLRGEAPIAAHLIYPQVFDDCVQTERVMGIKAGLAWSAVADATVVYTDRGISKGMQIAIDDAAIAGRIVEYRKMCENPRVMPIIAARRHLAEIEAQHHDAGVQVGVGGFTRWRGT